MEDDKKQGNKDDREEKLKKKVLKLALGAAERGEAAAQHQLLCECGPKK